MKLKEFIVTIQWGSGMRYILDSFDTLKQSESSKKTCMNRLQKTGSKRGAKPTVKIYKEIEL